MGGLITELVDHQDFTAAAGTGPILASTTVLTKAFAFHGWNQKIFLIWTDAPVVLSILYTLQEEIVPDDAHFFPLTTAKGVALPANEIIPFGVEDPVHFAKVKIETQLSAANVRVHLYGSRT